MDRRKFLQRLAATSLTSPLVASANNKISDAINQNQTGNRSIISKPSIKDNSSDVFPIIARVIGVGLGGDQQIRMFATRFKSADKIVSIKESFHETSLLDEATANEIELVNFANFKNEDVDPWPMTSQDQDRINESLSGAHLVFVVVDLTWPNCVGIAPQVAEMARAMGALVVGIVTLPFDLGDDDDLPEEIRNQFLQTFSDTVDSLVELPMESLRHHFILQAGLEFGDYCPGIIHNYHGRACAETYSCLTGPVMTNSLVACDFADMRSVVTKSKMATIGWGYATGPDRAKNALLKAMEHPLLGSEKIRRAHGLMVSISGKKSELSLAEVRQIRDSISQAASDACLIAVGTDSTFDIPAEGIRVSIFASGCSADFPRKWSWVRPPNVHDDVPPEFRLPVDG